jgi:hypothetical protein
VCYPLSTSATSSNGLNFGARPPHSEMTPIGTVRGRRRETRTAEGASGATESVTTMSSQTPTERPTAPQRTDPHGRTWWGSRTRRRHVLGQTTALLSVFQKMRTRRRSPSGHPMPRLVAICNGLTATQLS